MTLAQVTPKIQRGLFVERISPIDGRVVSVEPALDKAESLDMVARAAGAYPAWSALAASERAAYLAKAADVLEARRDDFHLALAEEIGAPAKWTHLNITLAAEILREVGTYADEAEKVEIIPDNRGITSKAVRVPCGVCLGISPWNAPLVLGFRAVAAPLLCGNTVLLKGSDFAPRTLRLIGEVFAEAGLPDGVMRPVLTRAEDSEEIVEALIASPVVRRVNFTGSTRVGQRVAELCAKYLKRPLLELGGQSTMLVLDDADLDLAAAEALHGAYLNQGQICMSTERLIVSETVADAFAAKLEALRANLNLGDPRDDQTDVGPVVSHAAAERFAGLVSDAVSKGARLVGGGSVRDNLVEPTLLDRIEPGMRVYHEEVFGPLVSITRVVNDLEAITVANDSEYGLVCSVFSQDAVRAEKVAHQLHSGICHINRCTFDDTPHAPFGGVKSSGYGRFGGRWGMHEFTELRWMTSASPT
ncbi:MAG: aldehyde dehydrogenase family protein [Thalassovita sp.]